MGLFYANCFHRLLDVPPPLHLSIPLNIIDPPPTRHNSVQPTSILTQHIYHSSRRPGKLNLGSNLVRISSTVSAATTAVSGMRIRQRDPRHTAKGSRDTKREISEAKKVTKKKFSNKGHLYIIHCKREFFVLKPSIRCIKEGLINFIR